MPDAVIAKTALVLTTGGFVDEAPAVPSLWLVPYGEVLSYLKNGYVTVNNADASVGNLENKIVGGTDITVSVIDDGGGNKSLQIAYSGAAAGGNFKVSANDTTPGPFETKIIAGTNISFVVSNEGGNETLTMNVSGVSGDNDKVGVSANDTTPGYLLDKVAGGYGIGVSEVNDAGDESFSIASLIGPTVNARLSLSSSDPVSDSDITGSTIYLHPYNGFTVPVREDEEVGGGLNGWGIYELTSTLSVSAPTPGSDTLYDVLLFKDTTDSSVSLVLNSWSSLTARSGSLAYSWRRGVVTVETPPSNITNGILMGTVHVNTSGQIKDTLDFRGLFNQYNRRPRPMIVVEDDVATSTYGTQAWRVWNNDTSNKFSFVTGWVDEMLKFEAYGLPTGNFGRIGLGINSTNTNTAIVSGGENGKMLPAKWWGVAPRLGFNEVSLLEYADAGGSNVTFNYDKNDGKQHLGGIGEVWA